LKTREELAEFRIQKAQRCLESASLSLQQHYYDESISSSYYAIFHSARALLAIENVLAKSHTGVISLFSLHFIKTGKIDKVFSKILSEAFNKRNESDYLDFFLANEKDATEQLKSAELFYQEVVKFIRHLER